MNRVLEKHGKGRVRWDTVDPEKALILQVRCGGGYGSGFYLDEERSLTLQMMVRTSKYNAMGMAIRDQAARILNVANGVLVGSGRGVLIESKTERGYLEDTGQ
jgi:hypothetical protein